ncbi:MAG: choice-of-anchor X domain-containing protein [Planctomycetota bacterium]|nr:choice-of-anchor X domain-containing protein [Planctomycetota bacterium]
MRRSSFAFSFITAAILVTAPEIAQSAQRSALVPRQVAAPASDLLDGTLRLPDPGEGAVRSHAAIFWLEWESSGEDRWAAEAGLPVTSGALGVAVQAFDASSFEIECTVGGAAVPVRARRDQLLSPEFGGQGVQRLDLDVASAGAASIRLVARSRDVPAPAVLVVRDAADLVASAHVDTHMLLADRGFHLVAQVEREGAPVRGVERATARVEGPGFDAWIDLRDDGLSGDGAAGDGRFGARMPAGLSGRYAARIELEGRSGGAGFLRTTRVTFQVTEPLLELTGTASSAVEDARRLRLDIDADGVGDAQRVQVAAEVWAHDELGRARPMAWLSRIDAPRVSSAAPDRWTLPLWLDAGWFSATGLRPPLELRAVRVQDPDHLGVLARADRLAVPPGPLPPSAGRVTTTISRLTGFTVSGSVPLTPGDDSTPVIPNPGLMLSHGYCSGGSPWPNGDFSAPKREFSDPNRNRSHDQFANRLAAQAAGYTSFGVVGHSQGANAALHLLTYYQSPLDRALGPRRIQSLGAPYSGTPLASLGFFACGVNDNLTPSGSITWLAGIPTWARREVYYYTTANSGFFACQFLTALLLSNPEDGTTEREAGQLAGANNMGHVTGWCHTTSMSQPAQYRDGARNAIIDALAAR